MRNYFYLKLVFIITIQEVTCFQTFVKKQKIILKITLFLNFNLIKLILKEYQIIKCFYIK